MISQCGFNLLSLITNEMEYFSLITDEIIYLSNILIEYWYFFDKRVQIVSPLCIELFVFML